jgi:heme-binding NEAT domain protein
MLCYDWSMSACTLLWQWYNSATAVSLNTKAEERTVMFTVERLH